MLSYIKLFIHRERVSTFKIYKFDILSLILFFIIFIIYIIIIIYLNINLKI